MLADVSPVLSVSGLEVELEGRRVFPPLSFTLRVGETLMVVGPNGAGKSVLLRTLLGLLPYRGTIAWREGTRRGYVPQRVSAQNELPLTVSDFLGLKRESRLSPSEALSRVGLSSEYFTGKLLSSISSGQFQRVLIAWSLMGDPDVLLFDEPTAGLDVSAHLTIHELLESGIQKRGLAQILVTHDLSTVYRDADQVLCISNDSVFYGPPEEVLDPKRLKQIYGREIAFHHHD